MLDRSQARRPSQLFARKRHSRDSNKLVSFRAHQLSAIWPFHLVIRAGCCCEMGPSLEKCLIDGEILGKPVQKVLTVTAPEDLEPMDWRKPERLLDRPLELSTRGGLCFSGELQPLQGGCWILILHPVAYSLQELQGFDLTLQDLSLSNPLRHHILHALLNEGLQHMLLQEVIAPQQGLNEVDSQQAWLELELG